MVVQKVPVSMLAKRVAVQVAEVSGDVWSGFRESSVWFGMDSLVVVSGGSGGGRLKLHCSLAAVTPSLPLLWASYESFSSLDIEVC